MANKRVWLTTKGQEKVGINCIYTTDEKIVTKSSFFIITDLNTGKTYILGVDDIKQIEYEI
jgi:hypothetical protein